jgi:uncharacterized protein (DUF2267 family)
MTAPQAVDWFRVIWDLVQRGVKLADIDRTTRINESTLRGYLAGSQPPHWRGELIIGLWMRTCNRKRSELPMAQLQFMPRVVERRKDTPPQDSGGRMLQDAWLGKGVRCG